MPTYTYRCTRCHCTFDRRNVPADDRDDQYCDGRRPECEGARRASTDTAPPRLERQFDVQVPPRMRYGWGEGR